MHAWTYRNWVVKALNEDMPFDRFLKLQLAADQIEDREPDDSAAMGFLTVGRRFIGVNREIIDDRIDVVTRGTMALTVSCARCHDHKYDPIATADYYSLYGVFESCIEKLERLPTERPEDEKFEAELTKRQSALSASMADFRKESSDRVRKRLGEYLAAQKRLGGFPAEGFDQIFQASDLLPAFVRRWEEHLRRAKITGDPVWTPWHVFYALSDDEFADRAEQLSAELKRGLHGRIHPLVAARFETPPQSFDDVIARYVRTFEAVSKDSPSQDETPLHRVLFHADGPCEIPLGPIVNCDKFFDSSRTTRLWNLQGEVDKWILASAGSVPFALGLVDRETPSRPRIFRRGNPIDKGREVPRQFLPVLAAKPEPFRVGSGRLELAEAIASPDNPLTARVIVNRIWAHHFGKGLVTTPSDFGLRAAPPSHPELLDWLASQFVADGWSLKELHRMIVLSTAFRQSSQGPVDPLERRRHQSSDPENRRLWRTAARRLRFEELRDSMLRVSGSLDFEMGGRPFDLFAQPFGARRTLYGRIDRQFLPSTLRTFDFANPDIHIAVRRETTIPQQALFLLNHPLMMDWARSLARHGTAAEGIDEGVSELFTRSYQRRPTAIELEESKHIIHAASSPAKRPTAEDWQYGYGNYDEKTERVAFTPLPHFTGSEWRGGPAFPDPMLGWVQLTATGGHPGNDRKHASIRRWVAPRDMTIRITSRLVHEPTQGDGMHGLIVSSTKGRLASVRVHNNAAPLNVERLAVKARTTVDFVGEISGTINYDQYLWSIAIEDAGTTATETKPAHWNSVADFATSDRLTGWEQLAQLLLCTNEFFFVD